MHHVTLNGAGPHDGDFDDQIIKIPGLEARQHAHLGPAFHLEYTDAVAITQHVIDQRVFRWNGDKAQIPAITPSDQIKGLVNASQHAETQNIHLQDA
jgi:hypothetical protein